MAETVRIEIPIETIDETEPELSNLIKKIGKLGDEADRTGQKTKKSSEYVSEFDKRAQKTERNLASWAKEKYEILLEAKDKISPVVSTIRNGLKSFSGKTWDVTMRAVDLITSPVRGIINLLKNPVFQVGAVLGVSIGLKDTIETYKDFEAAMSQVQAISGATSSEITNLTNKAKEMGATTKFTAEESAEAFNYMAMAGWKTGDMLDGIEGILSLAAASGESLANTSDIVTDALTAFGLSAADSGHFADVLAQASANANTNVSMLGESFKYVAPVAGAMKYTVEDVSLALGLMANASVKGSMSGTALKTSLANLAAPTDKMASAMDRYGISITDSDGKMKTLKGVMDNLRDSLGGLAEAEQTAAASNIFGKEAMSGMLAIVNASEADYKKLAEAVNNADGAAQNMSDTMLDNLQGSITLLQSAVDGTKITIGDRLSPYVRSIAEGITEQMPTIEQGLNQLMDWVENKVDRMQRKFDEIADTQEWQDADFFGKIKIAWDEFIAEPFSEWWNNTGKAKFEGFAQDIGSGIGTGLKAGVMTLLGIDLGETVDEGASIGASFARGFSEGFDFNAVFEKLWQGFGNLVQDAGKLLPGGESADLSSILSAVMLSKIASPLISIGKGAASIGKGLFGANPATGVSLASSIIGSTGNAMVQGTGLLNVLANAGYSLTGGAASAGGYLGAGTAMSGTSAALVGGAGIAGGVAAGATLISSALDAYKAIKSDDADESKAYGESAAWKAGGVAAGAAAGAAIGSIIPGLGTVVGAFVGAGVGGIAGWIKGNKIKEEYQENVEEMQKEAEKAQKVFEATGLSIEDITFKNEALTQAMNDSEVSAEQFALMFQEECANVAKKAFGDITLSLEEVKKVASEITFADMAEELSEFAEATADTEAALGSLESSASNLKKENWKVGLGMELSESDKDSYKSAIDSFLGTSQAYIDDNHYQATVALKLLTGGEVDTTNLDSYYGSLKSKIEDLGAQLTDAVNISLDDGVITLDESAELENLQNQISEITGKLTGAKTDAEMQALQIKYNGAALDVDSFNVLQEELQANVASASEQYESALTLTLTNLNLQLADGAITQDEYDEAVAEATDGYYAQINELSARVSNFNLDSIATAWGSELSRIMPDIEGSATEKFTAALNNALLAHPDVKSWTTADIIGWMGLDKLDLDTAEQTTIAAELIQTALAVPEGTKETILQDFKSQIPTAEEIKDSIDWESMTNASWRALMESITGPTEEPVVGENYYGKYFESIQQAYSEALHNALEESNNQEALSSFLEKYMAQQTGDFDFSSVMAQYGPISNECYEQIVAEWQEAGTAYGDALNNGASTSLLAGSSILRTDLQTALNTATASPFAISPTVNVNPNYNITAPTFPAVSQGASGHAAGGYVSGGPQLSWLAEEGYGEYIIPTNPSRRARALELYEQAGVALGVSAHADGGFVGGSISSNPAINYNLFSGANRNAPIAYNNILDGNYDGETATYASVPAERESSSSGSSVQVNVSLEPEFVINGGDGQNEEDIMQVIRKHMKEMADELGGEIAGKLEEVFSNMPLKEA